MIEFQRELAVPDVPRVSRQGPLHSPCLAGAAPQCKAWTREMKAPLMHAYPDGERIPAHMPGPIPGSERKRTQQAMSRPRYDGADVIDVECLVKRYRSALHNAVDGINFTVSAGEFFALLGPNGAGKTTTFSILTTTLAPTSGRVRIAGVDVCKNPAAVRKQIGIIFQNPSLDMNLSGEENVRLHAALYGLYPYRPSYRLMSAAYRRHISDMAAVLAMESDMFQPVRMLSGGMRRKLEIIRGLMHRPRVPFP